MDANLIVFLQALSTNEAQDVWQLVWQTIYQHILIVAVAAMGVALSMVFQIINRPEQDYGRVALMVAATIVMCASLVGHYFKEQQNQNYSLTELNTEIAMLKQNQPAAYNQQAADYVINAYKQCYVDGYKANGGQNMQCPKTFFFETYLAQLNTQPTSKPIEAESNWWKYLIGIVIIWALLSVLSDFFNKKPKPE